MNLEKALTYPFDDKQWASKIGLGALISIIPILNFALLGYVIELMRRVIKGDPCHAGLGRIWVENSWMGCISSLPAWYTLCQSLS